MDTLSLILDDMHFDGVVFASTHNTAPWAWSLATPGLASFHIVTSGQAWLMREGLPNSPTINAAYENMRAARTAIDSRKAAYLPRLDLRAYASRDNNPLGVTGHQRVDGVELEIGRAHV